MGNKKNIKLGDYVRWLYPLGYVNPKARRFSYGLVMDIREEDDMDGQIALLLDSG